jgi:transcriptional regulator GlxA family with amidase domain
MAPLLRTRKGWPVESPAALAERATQACFSAIRPLSDVVRRARRIIDERYREPLTVETLASEVAVSPSHLRRLFVREMGKTPKTYRDSLRVLEMAWLLTRTYVPLARVAALAGWRDGHNAARVFTRAAGMTPSEYRRAFQAANPAPGDGAFPLRNGADLLAFTQ